MGNITKNIKIEEIIPQATYKKLGDRSIILMDMRIILTKQFIRDRFGVPLRINSWHINGNRNWSGLRTPDSPYYNEFSQHSYGRAIDSIPIVVNSEDIVNEIREDIIVNYDRLYKPLGVGAIELDVSWLHIDTRINLDGKLVLDYDVNNMKDKDYNTLEHYTRALENQKLLTFNP